VAKLDDPRSIGEALRGSRLGEFWKYRVGDYRLICKLEDDRAGPPRRTSQGILSLTLQRKKTEKRNRWL